MALTTFTNWLAFLVDQCSTQHCSQDTWLCPDFGHYWPLVTLIFGSHVQTFFSWPIARSSTHLIFHTSNFTLVFSAPRQTTCPTYIWHPYSYTSRSPFHFKIIAYTYKKNLHSKFTKDIAMKLHFIFNVKIQKNYQTPNHSTMKHSSYANKLLTWGCLFAFNLNYWVLVPLRVYFSS